MGNEERMVVHMEERMGWFGGEWEEEGLGELSRKRMVISKFGCRVNRKRGIGG